MAIENNSKLTILFKLKFFRQIYIIGDSIMTLNPVVKLLIYLFLIVFNSTGRSIATIGIIVRYG